LKPLQSTEIPSGAAETTAWRGDAHSGVSERKTGSLDNHTNKGTPPRLKADLETGEILPDFDPTMKWQLQAIARLALGVFDSDIKYEDAHRIKVCMRHHAVKYVRQPSGKMKKIAYREVEVRQSRESLKTYYAKLMACGLVWCCPVCAPKIQHIRAQEVRQAIDYWTELGGSVVMPTHTAQHTRADKLSPLLEAFTKALKNSKKGKGYKLRKDRHGICHSIRALEVTHGSNGWHPHAHTIMFLDRTVCLDELASDLFPLWESAVRRAGLRDISRKAFKVVDASKVKSYITKMGNEYQWNAEHELVKAHSKSGKGASSSPFDFLRANLETSNPAALGRFAEFATCFKGKRQLVWSNGAKKALLGTEGATDQQIADSIGELDPVLARITAEDWKIIRKYNQQGNVLQLAQQFGEQGIKHLISQFRKD